MTAIHRIDSLESGRPWKVPNVAPCSENPDEARSFAISDSRVLCNTVDEEIHVARATSARDLRQIVRHARLPKPGYLLPERPGRGRAWNTQTISFRLLPDSDFIEHICENEKDSQIISPK